MDLVKKIKICEVGPRDGLQNEATILTTEQKVEIIKDMIDAGFKVIEVGSFVSPKAVPQMANTDEVFKLIPMVDGVEYRTLIANVKGVERAAACGCKKVKLNVSASKAHNLANLNKTPEESVAGFKACVDKALENNIEISGSISMAFGSPWDKEIPVQDVKDIVQAYLNVGVTEISLSDASGMAYPTQVYEICSEMKKEFPQVNWWLHFHNTRGLGISNIVAGMQAGITQFDTSFAGVGGCPFVPGAAGNVSTEDVIHMCNEMNVETGIDLDKAMLISKKIVEIVGHSTDSYLLRAGKSKDLIRELPTGQIKNQVKSK
ncbi:hydroxymethylglutaryl-CoA lyase [Sedimentibacter acidaminivorans]|uniref:Hydroxymethylglutaryl-CoA lyase n=1 Tax=Sedimentibacter acidaminivorans TaxID=913099 RepID=A0ABS4GAI5_9FIRM|nr:hydroxymethylglutaryl-CoA lyase [Sedimentibacter acidaminivorans]MBP1924697.1 hydroxymethylglutaryl-CoA lyase [Sedimentibacter acidaminivorans]